LVALSNRADDLKILLLLLLAAMLMTSACATRQNGPAYPQNESNSKDGLQSQPSQNPPDIAAILANQSQVMQQINTCRNILHTTIDFKTPGSTRDSLSITIDIQSDLDILNRQMNSQIFNTINLSGKTRKMYRQMITTGDRLYYKDGLSDDTTTAWQVKDLDAAASARIWSEQDSQITGSKYSGAVSVDNYTYGGIENVDGIPCYKLEQSLDSRQLQTLAPDLLDQLKNAQQYSATDIENMLNKINLTYLVDESGYLREVRIWVAVDQVVQGKRVTGTIEQYSRYGNFNEPVIVQIPAVK
jgi:hypothetical protein